MFAAVDKRTIVNKYCPLSCAACPVATTTKKAVATTTTKPKTTAAPEVVLNRILSENTEFKELLQGLDHGVNSTEGLVRFALYQEKKASVDEHNILFKKGKSKFEMRVNSFSIAMEDEIAPNALKIAIPAVKLSSEETERLLASRRKREASTVDWREHMKAVTDQGNCGGCWAFALNAMIESILSIKGQPINESLSVQQLLDCDRSVNAAYGVGNLGCGGGYFQVAADYLEKKGLTSWLQYPFKATSVATCALSTAAVAPRMESFDSGYVTATSDTEIEALNVAMENRVRNGPVAVGMAVSNEIYSYGNGVFDGSCGTTINHAVVIVGFTPEYWIIRNSWGSSWGEAGHIRVSRVTGRDPCFLVQYWSTVTAIGTFEPIHVPIIPGGAMQINNSTNISQEEVNDVIDGDCCAGECCECGEEDEEDDDQVYSWENDKFSTSTVGSTEEPTTTVLDQITITTTGKTLRKQKTTTTAKPTTKKRMEVKIGRKHFY